MFWKKKYPLICSTHLIRKSDGVITILNWPGRYDKELFDKMSQIYRDFYENTHEVMSTYYKEG